MVEKERSKVWKKKNVLIGRIQFTIHVISKYSWSRSRTCSLSIVVWKKIDRVYDAMVLILESISCAYLSYCYETPPFSSNLTDNWYYHHNHYLVRKLSKRAPRYFKIIEICTGRIQLASCSSFGNFRLPYLYNIIFWALETFSYLIYIIAYFGGSADYTISEWSKRFICVITSEVCRQTGFHLNSLYWVEWEKEVSFFF